MTSSADGEPGDPVIMILRHGEKPLHPGSPHGVTPEGTHDKHSLTVDGWVRAGALVGLLAPGHGEPPEGLRRPDSVYGAGFADGDSKRSVQTVTPLAARLGLEVVDRFAEGQETGLAEEITAHPGVTVVSWHHETIHRIVKHLGEVTPHPPKHWPDDRYDVIWTFTRTGETWRFQQVPQLLLPGDLPEPI